MDTHSPTPWVVEDGHWRSKNIVSVGSEKRHEVAYVWQTQDVGGHAAMNAMLLANAPGMAEAIRLAIVTIAREFGDDPPPPVRAIWDGLARALKSATGENFATCRDVEAFLDRQMEGV
jgi:hypothetical protein